MQLLQRMVRAQLLLAILWAGGLYCLWRFLPFATTRWQPRADENLIGYLDQSTAATVRYNGALAVGAVRESGPIRYWDIETGALIGECFGESDGFDRVQLKHGRLHIREKVADREDEFRLRVLDARSFEPLGQASCRNPRGNVWWETSRDGRYVLFDDYSPEGEARVLCCDLATGKRLAEFPKYRYPRFSEDGAFVYAVQESAEEKTSTMTVWESHSWREKGSITAKASRRDDTPSPICLDRNGKLLVDSEARVWDLHTQRLLLHVPKIYYNCIVLSPDGRFLIVEHRKPRENWIAWYDIKTGEEDLTRRVNLGPVERNGMGMGVMDEGRYLISSASHEYKPDGLDKWLAKVPGLAPWFEARMVDFTDFVDCERSELFLRIEKAGCYPSPNCRYLWSRGREGIATMWYFPLRKSWTLFLAAVLAWTAPLAWLARRSLRKRRLASSPHVLTLAATTPPPCTQSPE